MKTKSKKAVTFLFTTKAQASAAIATAAVNYENAKNDVLCAIEVRKAAWGDLRYMVTEAAKAGFKLEVRASAGTMALTVQEALRKAGYSTQAARNLLTELRGLTGTKNAGKRAKKTATQAGPVSGITINIKAGAKPEQVKNRVIDMANYLKAEYPNDEGMLRIAAFLADVVDA